MKYEGKVYAKIAGRYIECTQTVKELEDKIFQLKKLLHEIKDNCDADAINLPDDMYNEIKNVLR